MASFLPATADPRFRDDLETEARAVGYRFDGDIGAQPTGELADDGDLRARRWRCGCT